MKKALLLSVALFATPVFAADLSLKAPQRPFALPIVDCTPTNCSGFYAGFNIMGIGTSLDVLGGGLNNSLFAAGFGLGGQAGYQLWNGTYFFAAEVAADYMTNSPSTMGANTGTFRTTELVKAGIGLSALFGGNLLGNNPVPSVPSQGPVLPMNLLAQVTSPYAILGMGQKSGSNAFVSGAGVQAALAQGWNLSIEYQNWQYKNEQVSALVTQPTENIIAVKLNRMF